MSRSSWLLMGNVTRGLMRSSPALTNRHIHSTLNVKFLQLGHISLANAPLKRLLSSSPLRMDKVPPGFENFGDAPQNQSQEPPKRKESTGPSMDKKKSDQGTVFDFSQIAMTNSSKTKRTCHRKCLNSTLEISFTSAYLLLTSCTTLLAPPIPVRSKFRGTTLESTCWTRDTWTIWKL